MGRTPKPLKIAVHPSLFDRPEIQALAAKGHTVERLELDADVILGPTAWWMTEALMKYVELAVKRARGLKYGRKEEADAEHASD